MENQATSYQIISEIRHPNGQLLYSENIPEVYNFTIKRELLTDQAYYEEFVIDKREEHLKELKEKHPSKRHWYNPDGFVHKQLNEIIHIDCNDANMEDMYSFVNCHIIFYSNKDGSVLYEFGTPVEEIKQEIKKNGWQKFWHKIRNK